MEIFMTYSYQAMVIFFTCIFTWILFSLDSYEKQLSCAVVLVPLVLRMFLIR